MLIGPDEGQYVVKYAKNVDKPFASMQFKQTIIYRGEACTNCGFLSFKRSIAVFSKHLEARYI
jgi:hypothetical protein